MLDWIARLYEDPQMLRMGHEQRKEDLNLGLGWVYYGLARTLRPRNVVAIGSFRGFVPLVLGKAIEDNAEPGRLLFIDPSLVDDFWKDAEAVRAHFADHGVHCVEHHLMTTQQFAKSPQMAALDSVDMLFVDGFHSYEQARFDYETFEPLLTEQAIVLFHDSVRVRTSGMYGKDEEYDHRVKCFMDELKRDAGLQVMDLPLGDGLTLVRKIGPIPPWRPPEEAIEGLADLSAASEAEKDDAGTRADAAEETSAGATNPSGVDAMPSGR